MSPPNTMATAMIAPRMYLFAENQDSEDETPPLRKGSVLTEVLVSSLSTDEAPMLTGAGGSCGVSTTCVTLRIRSWLVPGSASNLSAEDSTAAAVGLTGLRAGAAAAAAGAD